MNGDQMRKGLGKRRLAELRQMVSEAADEIDHQNSALVEMQYLKITGRMQGSPMKPCRSCGDEFANLSMSEVCSECSYSIGFNFAMDLVESGRVKVGHLPRSVLFSGGLPLPSPYPPPTPGGLHPKGDSL